jgi:hypothetical protein
MTATHEPGALPRAFPATGIEILDGRFSEHGEVTLWSVGGIVPHSGDLFTIERDRRCHDLAVVAVNDHAPGWSVVCRYVEITGL